MWNTKCFIFRPLLFACWGYNSTNSVPEAAASVCMIFQYVPVCVCNASDKVTWDLGHWSTLFYDYNSGLLNGVKILPFIICAMSSISFRKRLKCLCVATISSWKQGSVQPFSENIFFKMLWNNSFTITLLHRAVGDTCPQKNAVTLVHHLRYLTLTCLSIQKDLMMNRLKWSWAKYCCMYIDP